MKNKKTKVIKKFKHPILWTLVVIATIIIEITLIYSLAQGLNI